MAVRTVGRALAAALTVALLTLAGWPSSQETVSVSQGTVVVVGGALFDSSGAPPHSGLALAGEVVVGD